MADAPLDGRSVLLWVPGLQRTVPGMEDAPPVVIGRWILDPSRSSGEWISDVAAARDVYGETTLEEVPIKPTHWHSLPAVLPIAQVGPE